MSASAQFHLPPVYVPPVEPSVPGTGLVYQPDHAGEASARLLAQFDDSAKLHALVRALVRPLQALEQAALEVIESFRVEDAYGAQLDMVGGLVGQPREAKSDIAYRAYIMARILANSADGSGETIYQIARALLGTDLLSLTLVPGYVEAHPAHYDLEVTAATLRFPWDVSALEPPDVVARSLADALFLATSAGVSFTMFYQYADDAHSFTFSSVGDAEEDSTTQGFADDDDEEAQGGAVIGAEERY